MASVASNMTIQPHQDARGFTLIEVLISVVVLGLGLLGLAAVFPAVVVQQRSASEAVEGESLVQGVRNYIASTATFNANRMTTISQPDQGSLPEPDQDVLPPGVLRTFLQVDGNESFGVDGRWVVPLAPGEQPQDDRGLVLLERDGAGTQEGDLEIVSRYRYRPSDPDEFLDVRYRIPIGDRLIPSLSQTPRDREGGTSLGEAEPRFVWDVMFRRRGTPNQPSEGDSLQAAIFIRRIDAGIRRPANGTLVDIFRPRTAGADVFVPVAGDNDRGVALFGGRGDYSLILEATITLDDSRESTPWALGTQERLRGIAQVGQIVVGPRGEVHTVSAVERAQDNFFVSLSPQPVLAGGDLEYDVWFTPQVPVAVDVFDVTPRF